PSVSTAVRGLAGSPTPKWGQGTRGTMNRITVYERANFEGLSREFTCDVPDLHELDFGNCIASLKVEGQPWIAYTDPKYEGESHAFEEGEYPSVDRPNSFSALRLVHHDLGDPQITLYEHPNFQGACKVVTEETNLAYGYFNDRVASHVVQRGVWLLYQHPRRGGWHCLLCAGAKQWLSPPWCGTHGDTSVDSSIHPWRSQELPCLVVSGDSGWQDLPAPPPIRYFQ
uniref:Beta/gamma crystallin 'Greek key' domain-containing protein n=1 Tax=Malurus cyaneus samueli TaxID=2593467 RepID=A0A8C5TF16_9PASS